MLFIRQENLKVGMRLAKPIYNKKGVLLYDRDSKLTVQGIESVKNFGIIGLYILEPAEPLPPMTEEDMEFERFQTVSTFVIQDELKCIFENHKTSAMSTLTASIIKNYGRLEKKINFVQSLRSKEDYLAKHSLNVAILCAMMSHVMNIRLPEQLDTVTAAIVHDIGRMAIPKETADKLNSKNENDQKILLEYEKQGTAVIEAAFLSTPAIKRIVAQSYKLLHEQDNGNAAANMRIVTGAKILMAADTFDTMTAMNDATEPSSEITALRYLMNRPEMYDKEVVDALIKSINFLNPGCCVELTNGEKGLVLVQNNYNILKPMILCFSDNSIVDLAQELIYAGLDIKDVMKTMDNRCIMDRDALKKAGIPVPADSVK